MKYLLDTNAISELYKPAPNKFLVDWYKKTIPDSIYLSVISIGEIRRGIEKLKQRSSASVSEKVDRLAAGLAHMESAYTERIWMYDKEAAHVWGTITAHHNDHALIDAQIAATAITHDAILVTRNTKDFKGLTLEIFNPFEPA